MEWWYWFGMWVLGIASLVVAWWLFIDAYRRGLTGSRLTWPTAAAVGIALQVPALLIPPAIRDTRGGPYALLGVAGVTLIAIAAVTYFTGSPSRGQDAGTWTGRTRDVVTLSHSSEGRRRREPARATIPVAEVAATSGSRASTPAAAVGSAQSGISQSPDASQAAAEQPEPEPATIEAAPARGTERNGNTSTQDDAVALSDARTITIDRDPTLVEETPPTIIDEPAGSADSDADDTVIAELAVTGGTSSRIVVTERTGPFRVGRDPSRTSLAVDDGRVSRVHFIIDRVGDDFLITDAGSSNGTFVNGSAVIEPRRLLDGDTIEFGRSVATFTLRKKTAQ